MKLPESLTINNSKVTAEELAPLYSQDKVSLDAVDLDTWDTAGIQLVEYARFSVLKAGSEFELLNLSDERKKDLEMLAMKSLLEACK